MTGVSALPDGTGYTITFQNSGAVTILNGKDGAAGAQGEKGETPQISTKKDTDGKYYWTLNGEWLLNNGAKIPTSGNDAIAPVVRINSSTTEWEISTDGGANYISTGVKAQGTDGDSFFKGVDNTNSDYLILTLNDGTSLQLAKYKSFKIGMDDNNEVMLINGESTIPLRLPAGFKKSDYTMITAEVKSPQGTGMDIQSRAATTPWTVKITKPTFKADGTCNNDATVTVTTPEDVERSDYALLEVTLTGNDGTKLTASRGLQGEGAFTDAAFRKAVITQVTGLKKEDGVTALAADSKAIPLTEANINVLAAFSGGIYVYGKMSNYGNVKSLKGIEYLTEMTIFNCNYNKITKLDVSKNTKLQKLYCSYNQLKTLDVTNNTELTDLDCSNTELTDLDVTRNKKLNNLVCNHNQIKTLDVANNTELQFFDCSFNKLTDLNVTQNIKLEYVYCNTNQLQALELTKNTKLISLTCSNNQFQQLDVTKNTKLKFLFCDYNQIKTPDVKNNTELQILDCNNNQTETLDVTKNTKLTTLYCYSNKLQTLDVKKNTKLTTLYCNSNQLQTLDVTENTELQILSCNTNQLQTLDVTNNTELTSLTCSYNQIKILNVNNNIKLTALYCNNNKLQTLDISALQAIGLWYAGNQTNAEANDITINLTLKEWQKAKQGPANFNKNINPIIVE